MRMGRKEIDREAWSWLPRLHVPEAMPVLCPAISKALSHSVLHVILTATVGQGWGLSPFHKLGN